MPNARTRTVPIESAIAAFHFEVKLKPESVCTCCHCMVHRKSVVAYNKVKYTKTSTDTSQSVYFDFLHWFYNYNTSFLYQYSPPHSQCMF